MIKPRWLTLMKNLGMADSFTCFNNLLSAYSETHRHYHNQHHIEAMLRHFDEVSHLFEHPYEAELAIWFHDAIYKPFFSKNELESAFWAQRFLTENDYSEEGSKRVFNLIMATCHGGKTQNRDEQLLVDIDLTILGQPEEIYWQFEKNVRKEYRLIPSFLFRKNRRVLLKSFVSRKNIYHSKYFRERFEETARDNIKKAIESLT